MLSNAPADPDEAVSLLECGDLAQDCELDTVVLISDACRSTPQGKVASRVRGSLVFPNRAGVPGKRSKVDRLLAAREGTPAYEVKIGENGELESVFTHCFLKAFKKPDSNMIASVTEDGLTIYVVPNRRLDKFLLRELEEVLAEVNIKLSQEPVIDIVSDDDVYMARVEALQGATGAPDVLPLQPAAPQLALTPADVVIAKTFDLKIDTGGTTLVLPPTSPTAGTAIITTRSLIRHALDASLSDDAKPIGDNQLDEIRDAMTHVGQERRSRETLFLRELGENIAAGGFGPASAEVKEFESGVGFTVTGATIDGVLMTGPLYGNNRIEVLEKGGDKKTGVLRVWLDNRPAASVLLVLSNGCGVPLAALAGYIGHILIRDDRVRNINYIPINPTHGQTVKFWRWESYLQNKSQLERLRALAASAITGNSFRIGDAKRADQLASIIRNVKAIDPMLGLFATYAYLEAGHDQELQSVRQYMAGDLDAELFDVAMLGQPNDLPPHLPPLRRVPFCPVLTQGWNYFRSRNIQLPSQLAEAQDQLVPGPFTMFEPEIAKTIFYALSRGELDGVDHAPPSRSRKVARGQNPVMLAAEWRRAFDLGVAAIGKTPPDGLEVDFPFYGDTFDKFTAQFDLAADDVATKKGVGGADEFANFAQEIAEEAKEAKGILDEHVRADMVTRHGPQAVTKGPENWEWVQSIISILDNFAPGATEKTFSLFLRDIFLYTRRTAVRRAIDKIIADKLTDEPTVVVGHSLGSVVAYNVLQAANKKSVLAFVTVGSPLGIRGINSSLETPWKNVAGVHGWLNAYDPRDVVALNPLDKTYFGVQPEIVNDGTLVNTTENHHGINSYLDKSVVTKAIIDGFV